ncbi:MAG: von Willebrand factor type A domain-containing protein [Polyangiaceae bacterium]|nr:von Willebrand factor type A domain-containing protein [Polyangiaceae bacterium]
MRSMIITGLGLALTLAGCSGADDSGSAAAVGSAAAGGSYASGGFSAGGPISGSGGSSGGYSGTGGGSSTAGSAGQAGQELDAGASADAEADASACEQLDSEKDTILFLSSDDSNSMGSPAIARSLLMAGQKVPPSMVRTHEFLNYYNVGYPAADAGSLSIVTELRPAAATGEFELQIGVASPPAVKPRRSMVLTFVLDTSGSMAGAPIARQADVARAIGKQLQSGDIVSILTWNTAQAVVLDAHVASGPNDSKFVQAINGLSASGGTDLSGGLSKGYGIAQKNFAPDKLNRVVLISDGVANVGVTDETVIGQGAMLNDGDGIYLVGVGVGAGVNDTLMDTVTDAGRGAYVYIDSTGEADKMFGPRFDEVMDIAARAVQVELRMPWYMAMKKFYGEKYSTNPKEVEPQHLAPNDAMVFTQIVKACDATLVDPLHPVEVFARWQTPMTHQSKEVKLGTTLASLLDSTPKYLPKGLAIIAFAEALKEPATAKTRLAEAKQLVLAAGASGDAELTEVQSLIEKAMTLY